MAYVEMRDGLRLRTWTSGPISATAPPVVLLHGGPGLPDYLEPVAATIAQVTRVHRYDQRGTGGSSWSGTHTLERHLEDLDDLLGAWGHNAVRLVGHSYGVNLALQYAASRPEQVTGVVGISGTGLGDWRSAYRAERAARMTTAQRDRCRQLEMSERSDGEEVEFLTLSWFTDHADRTRAVSWARESAERLRPVNYAMNSQLNAAVKVALQSDWLDRIRGSGVATRFIHGAGDPRPAGSVADLAAALGAPAPEVITEAGHNPWLEQPGLFAEALYRALTAGAG